MRILSIILIATLLTACSAERQAMRRSNRAAKLIEKARRIDPSIAEMKTIEHNISMRSPQVDARITQELAIPLVNESPVIESVIERSRDGSRDAAKQTPVYITIQDTVPRFTFPLFFEDDSLIARLDIDGNEAILDYTIKPQKVDTNFTTEHQELNPTKYIPKPLTWMQRTRITIGDITLILLLLYLIYRVMIRTLNAK